MVKVKAKFCKRKYWPASLLLKFTAMTFSKFKLQIKFKVINKVSYIVINFHLDLR